MSEGQDELWKVQAGKRRRLDGGEGERETDNSGES
jgi:hypothetical protein